MHGDLWTRWLPTYSQVISMCSQSCPPWSSPVCYEFGFGELLLKCWQGSCIEPAKVCARSNSPFRFGNQKDKAGLFSLLFSGHSQMAGLGTSLFPHTGMHLRSEDVLYKHTETELRLGGLVGFSRFYWEPQKDFSCPFFGGGNGSGTVPQEWIWLKKSGIRSGKKKKKSGIRQSDKLLTHTAVQISHLEKEFGDAHIFCLSWEL